MTKKCRECREELPLDQFGPSTKSKDGVTNTCLRCKAVEESAVVPEQEPVVALEPEPPVLMLPPKMLRHKESGFLYIWAEGIADDPNLELCE